MSTDRGLRRWGLVAFALAGLLLAVAMLGGVQAHEGEPGYRKGQIHAVQAWARINPVQGRPSAAYFVLHNESKVADRLIAANSPIAGRIEIHEHVRDNGVMKMRPVAGGVAVAVDDMVLFEPGGLHLMLFDVKNPPKAGTRFPITLTFQRGKPQVIQVEAKALTASAPKNKGGYDHHGHNHGHQH
jgi:periplasmic copper chaperone A